MSVGIPESAVYDSRIVHVTYTAGTTSFGVGTVVRELSTAQSQLGIPMQCWRVASHGAEWEEGCGFTVYLVASSSYDT